MWSSLEQRMVCFQSPPYNSMTLVIYSHRNLDGCHALIGKLIVCVCCLPFRSWFTSKRPARWGPFFAAPWRPYLPAPWASEHAPALLPRACACHQKHSATKRRDTTSHAMIRKPNGILSKAENSCPSSFATTTTYSHHGSDLEGSAWVHGVQIFCLRLEICTVFEWTLPTRAAQSFIFVHARSSLGVLVGHFFPFLNVPSSD